MYSPPRTNQWGIDFETNTFFFCVNFMNINFQCFQTRIYYDKRSGLLEEFTQKLVKDDCGNIQKRHDPTRNKVQISYCVTVLDQPSTLKWLQKYRLDEFIRSMIFAEYKLSKALSSAQVTHVCKCRSSRLV